MRVSSRLSSIYAIPPWPSPETFYQHEIEGGKGGEKGERFFLPKAWFMISSMSSIGLSCNACDLRVRSAGLGANTEEKEEEKRRRKKGRKPSCQVTTIPSSSRRPFLCCIRWMHGRNYRKEWGGKGERRGKKEGGPGYGVNVQVCAAPSLFPWMRNSGALQS